MAPFSPSPLPEDELFTAQFALEWGEQTFIRKLVQLTSLFSHGPAPCTAQSEASNNGSHCDFASV